MVVRAFEVVFELRSPLFVVQLPSLLLREGDLFRMDDECYRVDSVESTLLDVEAVMPDDEFYSVEHDVVVSDFDLVGG